MTSFANIQAYSRQLPREFWGVDEFRRITPDAIPGWGANVTSREAFTLENTIAGTARLISGMVILPIFASIGTLYHTVAGFSQCAVAVIGHMRNENREDNYNDLNSGLGHLITAVYNLVVGFLSTPIALVYAFAPTYVNEMHDKMQDRTIANPATDSVEAIEGYSYIEQLSYGLTESILPRKQDTTDGILARFTSHFGAKRTATA